MAKSYEELKNEISAITNEVEDGANTANRIGNAMADIVDYAKEVTDIQSEETDKKVSELEASTEQKIKDLVVQETGDGEGVVMSQKATTEKLAELESEIGASVKERDFSIGSYLSTDGVVLGGNPTTNATTQFFPLLKGQKLECNLMIGGETGVATIVLYNTANQFDVYQIYKTDNLTIDIDKDCFARFCYNTSLTNTPQVLVYNAIGCKLLEEINQLSEEANKDINGMLLGVQQKNIDFVEHENGYIGISNGIINEHPDYIYSSPFLLTKGDFVRIVGLGAANISSMLAKTNEQGTQYSNIVTCTSTGTITEYKIFIEEYGYYAYSYRKMDTHIIEVYSSDYGKVVVDENKTNEWLCQFYDKVICIGDSVTQGVIVDGSRTPDGFVVKEGISYPAYLAKMTNWEVENTGVGGITALGWWERKYPNYDYSQYQLAIIELGYNGGLTDTLDADAPKGTNYLNYADTNTGRYCSIIEGIKEQNPNIFIVLSISPKFVSAAPVVQKIAERYGLPIMDLRDNSYIDLMDLKYHGLIIESGEYDTTHFNAIGYLAKARLVYILISKIFEKEITTINNLKPL